jgi:hypothetical protein
MCIYRKGWFTEGKQKHDGSCLWAYALELQQPFTGLVRGQILQESQIQTAAQTGNFTQSSLNSWPFLIRQTGWPDGFNDLVLYRIPNCFPGRKVRA